MFYQKLILGAIQGVAEWLPVSSEGLIFLTSDNLFNNSLRYRQLVETALFLHLGTFLAALVYFRATVWSLLKTAVSFPKAQVEEKKLLLFITVATLISGLLGFIFLKLINGLDDQFVLTGRILNTLTGLFLLITGALQLRAGKKEGKLKLGKLSLKVGIALGLVQGLATLPGLSRSGLTVSTLLLLGFTKTLSLKLSFLLSLPIVFLGNVVLNLNSFSFSLIDLAALLTSFIFGLATIDLLLKAAKKVNFGLFVILFGLLTLTASFL